MLDGRIWLKRFSLLVALLIICGNFAFSVPSVSAAPDVVNYQSRLRDILGNPIVASTTIQFSIYNHATNGAPTDAASETGPLLWSETYDQSVGACAEVTPDSQGYFDVQLGNCVSFPDYLDFQETFYLGVKIEADNEASPRVLLAAHPFAMNAQRVGPFADSGSDELVGEALGTATAVTQGYNSPMLVLQGSGWTGAAADERELKVLNTVTDADNYQLSILNHSDVEIFSLDSEGLLGIGNDSPATALHVDSNDTNDTAIVTLENSAGDVQIYRADATPEGSITANIGDLTVDTTNGAMYLKTSGTGTNTGWEGFALGNLGSYTQGSVTFADASGDLIEDNANFFWDDANDRLGIGTDSPVGPLHVEMSDTGYGTIMSSYVMGVYESNDHGYLQFLNPSTTSTGILFGDDVYNVGGIFYTHSLDMMQFRINGDVRTNIASTGYMSIGNSTNSAESLLEIGDGTMDNIDGVNDVLIADDLEVDGTIYGNVVGSFALGFTEGSVAFADAGGGLDEDNANFFWDDTNNWLGVGTSSPDTVLDLDYDGIVTPVGDHSIMLSQDGGDAFLETASTDMAEGLIMRGGQGIGDYGILRNHSSTGYASGWDFGLHIYTQHAAGADPDDIIFSTDSVERMRITDTGPVGIGTDSPNALLQVGDVYDGLVLNISGDAGDTDGAIARFSSEMGELQMVSDFYGNDLSLVYSNSADTNSVHLIGGQDGVDDRVLIGDGTAYVDTANQRVGIGALNPSYMLEIADPGELMSQFMITGDGGDGIMKVDMELSGPGGTIEFGDIDGVTYGEVFVVDHDDGEFYFDNGSVGIGVTDPSADLDVGGGVADFIDGTNDVLVADDLEVDGTIYGTVDGTVTSAGNGLTLTSGEIDLGGDLDQNTYINHQGFSFIVREFAGEPETEFNGDNFKIINSSINREVRFGVGGADFAGLSLEGANEHNFYYRDDSIFITSDAANFEGLTYAADYSANYTDRSLVDKGYVDSVAGGGGGGTLDASYDFGGAGAGRNMIVDSGPIYISDAGQAETATFGDSLLKLNSGLGTSTFTDFPSALVVNSEPTVGEYAVGVTIMGNERTLGLNSTYKLLTEAVSLSGNTITFSTNLRSLNITESASTSFLVSGSAAHDGMYQLVSLDPSGTVATVQTVIGGNPGFPAESVSADVLEGSVTFGNTMAERALEVTHGKDFTDAAIKIRNYSQGSSLLATHNNSAATEPAVEIANNSSGASGLHFSGSSVYSTTFQDITSNYYVMGDSNDMGTTSTGGFMADPYGVSPAFSAVGYGVVGYYNYVGAADAGNNLAGSVTYSSNANHLTGTPDRWAVIGAFETDENGDVEARVYSSIEPGGGSTDAEAVLESSHEDNGGDSIIHIEAHKRGAGNSGDAYIELEAAVDDTGTMDSWIQFSDENDRLTFTQYGSSLGDDLLNAPGEVFSSTGTIGSSIGVGETSDSLVHALNILGTYAAGIGAGGGGTLDQAYDFGGAGNGRVVTVDSNPIQFTVPDGSNHSALTISQNDVTNDPTAFLIENAGDGAAIEFSGTGGQSIVTDLATNWITIANTVNVDDTMEAAFILDPYGNNPMYSGLGEGAVGLANYVGAADAGNNFQVASLQAMNDWPLNSPTRSTYIYLWETDSSGDVKAEMAAEVASGGDDDAIVDIRAVNEDVNHNAYAGLSSTMDSGGNGNAYTSIQARVLSGTGDGFISFTDTREDLAFTEDSAFFGDDLLNAAGEIFEATGTIGSISGETSDSLVHALNAVGTYAAGLGAGAGGTLDQAYDFGGAGAGRLITADSGAVQITVPDTSNTAALSITQNDTTNYPGGIDFGAGYAAITNDLTSGWSIVGDGGQFSDLTSGLFIDPYGNDPSLGGSQGFSGIMNFIGAATAGVPTQQIVLNNSDDDFSGTITRYSRIILNETDGTGDVSIDFDARTTSAATGDSDMSFNVISATNTGDAEFLVGTNKSSGTSGESTILLQATNGIADDSTITLNAVAGGTSTIQLISGDGDIYFSDERENDLYLTQDSVALGGNLLNLPGEIYSSSGTIGSNFSESSFSLVHAINAVGTYAAGIGAGAGGTLDMAYDFGGAGSGRIITADSDEVQIIVPDASGNVGLDIVQNDTTADSSVLQLTNNTDAGAAMEFSGSGPQVLEADLTTNFFMMSDGVDLGTTTGGLIYDPYGNESYFAAGDMGIAGIYNFIGGATSGRETQGSAIYASNQNYFLGTPTRSATIAALESAGSNSNVEAQFYSEIGNGGGSENAISHVRSRNSDDGGDAHTWIEADKEGAGYVGNAYITITARTDLDPSQRSWIEFEDDNESLNFTQYNSALGDDLLNSAGEIFSSTGTLGSVIGAGGETSTSLVHALNSLGNYVVNFGGGGGGTLDASYDTGGAGAGRSITADAGAVEITVPDTTNNAALTINQNDVTNNPPAIDFGSSVAHLDTDFVGGGYVTIGDGNDFSNITGGLLIDPYANEGSLGNTAVSGIFNFNDPDDLGLDTQAIALHTGNNGLMADDRYAQFIVQDNGDGNEVQGLLRIVTTNVADGDAEFLGQLYNTNTNGNTEAQWILSNNPSTVGDSRFFVHTSAGDGNSEIDLEVDSQNNGQALITLNADSSGGGGMIDFRDNQEESLTFTQTGSSLGDDLLNSSAEIFANDGTIGSTIGVGETSTSIVHALNALGTYAVGVAGAGSSLDQSYDFGGAGLGRFITADSGAVQVTVPDGTNTPGISIIQNDDSNDPPAFRIENNANGPAIEFSGTTTWSIEGNVASNYIKLSETNSPTGLVVDPYGNHYLNQIANEGGVMIENYRGTAVTGLDTAFAGIFAADDPENASPTRVSYVKAYETDSSANVGIEIVSDVRSSGGTNADVVISSINQDGAYDADTTVEAKIIGSTGLATLNLRADGGASGTSRIIFEDDNDTLNFSQTSAGMGNDLLNAAGEIFNSTGTIGSTIGGGETSDSLIHALNAVGTYAATLSGATVDLQDAYDNGPTVDLSSSVGDLVITTDESFLADFFIDHETSGYYLRTDASTDSLLLGDGTTVTSIVPGADDAVSLGTSTNRFADLYLGPSSLYIGSDGDDYGISYTTADDTLVFNDSGLDRNIRMESNGYENALFLDGGSGFVGLSNDTPAAKLDVDYGTLASGTTRYGMLLDIDIYGVTEFQTADAYGIQLVMDTSSNAQMSGAGNDAWGLYVDVTNVDLTSGAQKFAAEFLGAAVNVGDDTNQDYMDGTGDLYVADDLEVDGTIYGNISGNITSTLAEGSIPFADASGDFIEDNANFFWDDTNDRLGVGTATPGYGLHVYDAQDFSSTGLMVENNYTISGNSTLWLKAAGNTAEITYGGSSGLFIDTDTGSGHDITLAPQGNGLLYLDAATDYVGIDDSGPSALLDVGGGVADNIDGTDDLLVADDLEVDGLIYGNVSGTIDPGFTTGSVLFQGASGAAQDNTNFFWDDTNDRLGLGTNTPSYRLHSYADTDAPTVLMRAENASTATNAFAEMQLASSDTQLRLIAAPTNYTNSVFADSAAVLAQNAGHLQFRQDTIGGDIQFLISTDVEMTMTNGGWFGMGDETPVANLVVGSDASASYANGEGDVYIQNDLEVDGTIYGNISGNITSTLAEGSIPFADASGDFIEDNANLFWDDTNNRLGIGETTPLGPLHVEAQSGGESINFTRGTGRIRILQGENVDELAFYNNDLSQTFLFFENGGQVGIDDITPAAQLDVGGGTANFIDGTDDVIIADDLEVDGNIYADSYVGVGAEPLMPLHVEGEGNVALFTAADYASGTTGAALRIEIDSGEDAAVINALENGSSSFGDLALQYGGGNVGVGTDAPESKLHVVSSSNAFMMSNGSTTANFLYTQMETGTYSGGAARSTAPWQIGLRQTGSGSSSDDRYYIGRAGISSWDFVVDRDGQVGVGVQDALASFNVGGGTVDYIDGANDVLIADDLEVDGTIYGTLSGSLDTSFTTGSLLFANSSGDLAEDNANLFWNDTSNRLGIGEITPLGPLHVEAQSGGESINLTRGNSRIRILQSQDIDEMAFYNRDLSVIFLFFENGGQVAIGDETPAAQLDVGGGTADYIDGTNDLLVADDMEIDGNLHLHSSSSTVGVIYSAGNSIIHNVGTDSFYAGINAGSLSATASYNVGIGNDALTAVTSGGTNVAVGEGAMATITDGIRNIAIGRDALGSTTSASYNTAIGHGALNNNVGTGNTAIGFEALTDTRGDYNIAIGPSALSSLGTASNNVVLGYAAMTTNASGGNNVALGHEAGYSSTGSGNIFIGYQAGYSETGSNLLYIDNSNTGSPLIWGDFSNNYVNFNGTVGIGDTDPTNGGLVVASGVTIGADNTNNLIDDGTNGSGSATLYIGQNAIDTTAPSDERLKRDITATEISIEDLMAIEIVDFRYTSAFTDNDKTLYHGVIAQQVEDIYPVAVTTRSDGYKMVDYKSFIPLVMKSIQDQQGVLESIQNTMSGIQETETAVQGSTASVVLTGEVDNLVVKKHATFNGDTVGMARITQYETSVRVDFEEEYQYQPIVTATLMNYLHEDIDYIVKEVTSTGFTIEIDKMYGEDVEFSWHAFGSEAAKLFVSDGSTEEIVLVVDQGECGVDNLNACDTLDECKQLPNYYWNGECQINDPVEGMIEPEGEDAVEEEPPVEEDEPVVEEEEEEEEVVVDEEPVTEEEVEEEVPVEEEPIVEEEPVIEEEPVQEEETEIEQLEEPVVEEDPVVEEPETIIEE